jgi:phosphotransacetylase
MKQEQELLEKVERRLMMREGYKQRMTKREQELLERGVKPLIVVEEDVIK